MDNGLVLVVVILVVVWYFGSHIKAMLSGSADMASREFSQVQADQVVNCMVRDKARTDKFNELLKTSADSIRAKDLVSTYNEEVVARKGD